MAVLIRALAAVVVAGALGGCTARVINAATLFKPLAGTLALVVTPPPNEAFVRVQFQLNDQVVGEDTDPADGYSADIDTTGLEPETLAKIAAVGVRADGTTRVLRENLILVTGAAAATPTVML
ncbi:MAG: hypothetical protein VKS61_07035 [Candidatus Sericytochromatia bacterium]|nr:hypothetical protein [Candidatus Sericytochromatia bacterium]